MTREEFISDIECVSELIDFCEDVGCSECEDVISNDAYNDWIESNLAEWAGYYNWRELRDRLNELDDNCYDWYILQYCEDPEGIGDYEFEDLKTNVLNWCDENGAWDEEDDEDEEDETPQFEDEPFEAFSSDVCWDELVSASENAVQALYTMRSEAERCAVAAEQARLDAEAREAAETEKSLMELLVFHA